MCQGHTDLCNNVGLCIGAGRCVCPKGTVGEFCNKTGTCCIFIYLLEAVALAEVMLH